MQEGSLDLWMALRENFGTVSGVQSPCGHNNVSWLSVSFCLSYKLEIKTCELSRFTASDHEL